MEKSAHPIEDRGRRLDRNTKALALKAIESGLVRMKRRKSAQERMNYLRLDARGLSIRDHYRKFHPKFVKGMESKGEAEALPYAS